MDPTATLVALFRARAPHPSHRSPAQSPPRRWPPRAASGSAAAASPWSRAPRAPRLRQAGARVTEGLQRNRRRRRFHRCRCRRRRWRRLGQRRVRWAWRLLRPQQRRQRLRRRRKRRPRRRAERRHARCSRRLTPAVPSPRAETKAQGGSLVTLCGEKVRGERPNVGCSRECDRRTA